MLNYYLNFTLLFCLSLSFSFAEEHHSFELVWEETQTAFDKIINNPFIQEMKSGELPSEKFLQYMEQDFYYLHHDLIAFKILRDLSENVFEQKYLNSVIMDIEHTILNIFSKYDGEALVNRRIFPESESYVAHILDAVNENYYYAAGSLMTCVFSYSFIANELFPSIDEDNLYYHWFKMYKEYSIESGVNYVNHILNNASEIEYQEFLRGFERSMELELHFWYGVHKFTTD